VFGSWREARSMAKEEAALAAITAKMAALAASGDATLQKTMLAMGGAQDKELVNMTFGCWKELRNMAKEEAALEAINAKMAALAASGDATLQKTMMAMGNAQGKELLKMIFDCWKEVRQMAKEEADLEAMNQKIAEQAGATLQKTILAMGGAQGKDLMKMMFGQWREFRQICREEKALEEINKKIAAMNAKSDATLQKTMMAMGNAQGKELLKMIFDAWKEISSAKLSAQEWNVKKVQHILQLLKVHGRWCEDVQKELVMKLWLREVQKEKEELMMEATEYRLQQLAAKTDEVMNKTLGKWASEQGSVLMGVTMTAWKEVVVERKAMEREEASLAIVNAKMAELLAKGDATLQKTMLAMGGAQDKELVNMTFASWVSDIHAIHAQRKEDAALELVNERMRQLAASGDATLQKTMMAMGGAQDKELKNTTFGSWREFRQMAKEEAALEAINKKMAEMSSADEKRLQKTMLAMGNAQGKEMLGIIMQAWKDARQMEKDQIAQDALAAQLANLDAKAQATLQKTVLAMGGSQGKALLQMCFVSWREVVQMVKEEAALEEMNKKLEALANAGEATRNKTLSKIFAANGIQLVKQYFTEWKDDWVLNKETKLMDKLKAQMASMDAKNEATMQKTMLAMSGQQGKVLLQAAYNGWKEVLRAMAEEAATAAMAKKMAEINAKGEATLAKTMMKWAGDQAGVLLQTTFTAWRDTMTAGREEKAKEEYEAKLASMDAGKQQQLKNAAMKLIGDQASLLTSGTFVAWKEEWQTGKERKATEAMEQKVQAAFAAQKDNAMKTMLKLAGGNDKIVMQTAFQGWVEVLKEEKIEREKQKILDLIAAKDDQARNKKDAVTRLLASWAGQNRNILLMGTFDAWSQDWKDMKAEMENKKFYRSHWTRTQWLLDMQHTTDEKASTRARVAIVFEQWRFEARDSASAKAIQDLDGAMEEERELLRARCADMVIRVQQAEQEAALALAERTRSAKREEILQSKCEEESLTRWRLENDVTALREQVNQQSVRCRTMQRHQTALAQLQVGSVADRENLTRKINELSKDREELMESKKDLLNEQSKKDLLQWQLDQVGQGIENAPSSPAHSPTRLGGFGGSLQGSPAPLTPMRR